MATTYLDANIIIGCADTGAEPYHTEPTTFMKLRPAGLVMTWLLEVPVVMVDRGMVITGRAWAICCWVKGFKRVGWGVSAESWGVGVAEGVEVWMSGGWGVEEGVLVGVGVDGFGVPDPVHIK